MIPFRIAVPDRADERNQMSSTETIINIDTTDASTPHPKDLIRPLGAGEELMWLLDLSARIHFALAAEVEGRGLPDVLYQ
jgi:hypothetical protein